MRALFPLVFGVSVILLLGLVELLLLRYFNPSWWRTRLVRRAAWGLPVFGVAMVLLWGVGEYYVQGWLSYPAALLSALTFILEISLMLSLPVSGMVHWLHRYTDRRFSARKSGSSMVSDPTRRVVLKGIAAGLPLVTLSAGVTGFGCAFGDVRVKLTPMSIDRLPSSLEGLRILHLSDIHLRHYVTLGDLSEVLQRAVAMSPDFVLVTGDVADDLRLLPQALALTADLRPRYGVFACLGNHEYFRGVAAVRRIFDRSGVPLLVNEGIMVDVGSSRLFIGGIDDPRHLGFVEPDFYAHALAAGLRDSRAADFRVMMSHRPEAFDHAAEHDVEVMLAGHTHGAQIGLGGRSLFEDVLPRHYLWGHYQHNDRHLYTSSGVGHWFPFRLGCPPEAPILEFRRSSSAAGDGLSPSTERGTR